MSVQGLLVSHLGFYLMRRHANRDETHLGLVGVIHRHLAVRAGDWQRALEVVL